MRALIALAAPAIAGALMIAAPSQAAPLSLAPADAAAHALQVQYGGGGYGERREERGYGERREERGYGERRERRDFDGDRRYREREVWRGGDGDDWRRRAWKRRMFCRMHPDVC
jgi:hypothetical protein